VSADGAMNAGFSYASQAAASPSAAHASAQASGSPDVAGDAAPKFCAIDDPTCEACQ